MPKRTLTSGLAVAVTVTPKAVKVKDQPTPGVTITSDAVVKQLAALGQVDNPEAAAKLGELLKNVKAVRKKVDAHYSAMKRPITLAGRTIDGFKREALRGWEMAEALAVALWQQWKDTEAETLRQAQEEAESQAVVEAQEGRESAVTELRAAAEQVALPEVREKMLAAAAEIQSSPLVVIEPEAEAPVTDVGLSDYKVPVVECRDLRALAQAVGSGAVGVEFLSANTAAMTKLSRKLGDEYKPPPGCVVVQRRVTAG